MLAMVQGASWELIKQTELWRKMSVYVGERSAMFAYDSESVKQMIVVSTIFPYTPLWTTPGGTYWLGISMLMDLDNHPIHM